MELTLIKKYWKVFLVLVLLLGSFYAGWDLHKMKVGYEQNLEQSVKDEVRNGIQDIKNENIRNYNETKDYLEGQQFKVIKEQIPFILEKKVYSNQCLEGEGVDSLLLMRDNSKKARGLK